MSGYQEIKIHRGPNKQSTTKNMALINDCAKQTDWVENFIFFYPEMLDSL